MKSPPHTHTSISFGNGLLLTSCEGLSRQGMNSRLPCPSMSRLVATQSDLRALSRRMTWQYPLNKLKKMAASLLYITIFYFELLERVICPTTKTNSRTKYIAKKQKYCPLVS